MANVLIIYHQPLIVENNLTAVICFYESLAKELQNNNNNVLLINTFFLKEYSHNLITTLSNKNKSKFIESIKNFNADIIFAFNNQITEEILNNTSCPICVLDADSIDLFCKNAESLIKPNQDRYYFFSFSYGWECIDKYLNLGFSKKNIGYLHLATAVKNEPLEKTVNISFIGSYFGYPNVFDFYENTRELYELVSKSYNDNEQDYNSILNQNLKNNLSIEQIYGLLDTRVLVLDSLLDLGLNLYGKGWELQEHVLLRLAYIKELKYSLKHNQDIYNSSKINISISHPQCRGYAFPWRVYDIMASSGLLISSYSKNLEEQTKGIVKIPMYKSPYEARDLCKYALNNPNYREDIILASNDFIEKYGRWKSNFEIIENKVGVKLIKANHSTKKVGWGGGDINISNFINNKPFFIRYREFILFFSFLLSSKQKKHLKNSIINYKKIKSVSYKGYTKLE